MHRSICPVVALQVALLIALPCAAQDAPPTNEDFAAHVKALGARLKEKLPKSTFTILVQKPFVVVGDEREATVRVRSIRTVKWSVDALKALYFKKDPNEIIDIYLFKDKRSYETNATVLFGEKPSTTFGYYSAFHKALVMNISTGGGTLVHEIVHPFVRVNFPRCPAWFNEGFASLYEQCGKRDDRITGFTNWRLAGLQEAIREKRVPTFQALSKTTDHAFYNLDRGTNYAQARYLCYYLQEKGLLVKYWERFVAESAKDPTGYTVLKDVLGVDDMAAFQKEWEQFVLGLRFPS